MLQSYTCAQHCNACILLLHASWWPCRPHLACKSLMFALRNLKGRGLQAPDAAFTFLPLGPWAADRHSVLEPLHPDWKAWDRQTAGSAAAQRHAFGRLAAIFVGAMTKVGNGLEHSLVGKAQDCHLTPRAAGCLPCHLLSLITGRSMQGSGGWRPQRGQGRGGQMWKLWTQQNLN
jgi:hypothetical protein